MFLANQLLLPWRRTGLNLFQLYEMGVEVSTDLLPIVLLHSQPQSFENFRCSIESRDQLPSPESIFFLKLPKKVTPETMTHLMLEKKPKRWKRLATKTIIISALVKLLRQSSCKASDLSDVQESKSGKKDADEKRVAFQTSVERFKLW